MILNIVLLILVFGAEKKKTKPYAAALLLGGIKAAIYGIFTRDVVLAVFMGCLWAGLASAFVFFLKRLDRRDAAAREDVPSYRASGSEKLTFKWEYIPLVALLFLLIGGEAFLR